MCDYSLKDLASRPARKGETLMSTTFAGTSTHGFAAPNELNVAVCLLPGTELNFAKSVSVRGRPIMKEADVKGLKQVIGVPPDPEDLVATFIQVDKKEHFRHHDALEFSDGNIILLTDLEPGQTARVLTLPADPKTLADKEHQRRAEFV